MIRLYAFGTLIYLLILLRFADGKGGSGGGESKSFVEISMSGTAQVNRQLQLTCSYPKIKDPQSLFWFKWNDVIYADESARWLKSRYRASKESFKIAKRHTLIFDTVVLNDDGEYKCIVRDEKGVEIEGKYTLTIVPDTITIQRYGLIQLHCENVGGHIEYPQILIWKKDKSIIIINRTIVGHYPRYSLVNSDLLITNATESNNGVYTCYSDGKRIVAYNVKIFQEPVLNESALRGWRGYIFGVAIGIMIVGLLAIACVIQNRPFKGQISK